ncbi:MAG: transglutaminase domain-containing protein [Lachnospiraceae bacterium]|nr:transglutaminase domain-containing protein [Lachnospiraceae bacterium]
MMGKVQLFGIKEYMIYRVFYAMLLTLGVLYIMTDRELGLAIAVGTVLFSLGIIVLMACLNYLQLRGRVTLAFLSAGLLVLGLHRIPEGEFWENTYVRLLFLCVGIYLAEVILEKLPLLKTLPAAGMAGYLLVCLFGRYEVSHGGAMVLMWTVVLYVTELIEHFWKKFREHPGKSYMVWIMMFCVLHMTMALLTPAPEEPYDWQFVKDFYKNFSRRVTIWAENMGRGSQEDFGSAVTGFSEDGRLMSGLVADDKEILRVQGNRGLKTNVYLMGKIYDTFWGNGWSSENSTLEEDRLIDTLESIYYLEGYDSEFSEDYFAETKLNIEYLYFNTGYVFAPLKTWKMIGAEYVCDGANLRFEEQKGYSTAYSVYYQQLNVNHPSFYAFVNSTKEEDAERWAQVIREYVPGGKVALEYEELEMRRQEIRNCYLPETTVSEEVRAYLDALFEGADTPVEKLLAIEEALWQLEYTMTPGALPEKVTDVASFLDYFLLENKKGYCSYFATAFVLLARAEGFPARYVEGFCLPVDSDKTVTAYSYMAHAWPEVYLEGVGWIPFEPTPGYEEIRYTPWEPVSETAQSVIDVESLMPVEEEEDVTQEVKVEEKPELTEEEKQENARFVVLTVLGILGCVVGFLWLDTTLRKRSFTKMLPEEKFRKVAMNNLWLLSRLGIRRADQETMEEMQVKHSLSYEFVGIWEDLTYGDKAITEQDIALALKEQDEILKQVKEKNIWLYYLVKLRV